MMDPPLGLGNISPPPFRPIPSLRRVGRPVPQADRDSSNIKHEPEIKQESPTGSIQANSGPSPHIGSSDRNPATNQVLSSYDSTRGQPHLSGVPPSGPRIRCAYAPQRHLRQSSNNVQGGRRLINRNRPISNAQPRHRNSYRVNKLTSQRVTRPQPQSHRLMSGPQSLGLDDHYVCHNPHIQNFSTYRSSRRNDNERHLFTGAGDTRTQINIGESGREAGHNLTPSTTHSTPAVANSRFQSVHQNSHYTTNDREIVLQTGAQSHEPMQGIGISHPIARTVSNRHEPVMEISAARKISKARTGAKFKMPKKKLVRLLKQFPARTAPIPIRKGRKSMCSGRMKAAQNDLHNARIGDHPRRSSQQISNRNVLSQPPLVQQSHLLQGRASEVIGNVHGVKDGSSKPRAEQRVVVLQGRKKTAKLLQHELVRAKNQSRETKQSQQASSTSSSSTDSSSGSECSSSNSDSSTDSESSSGSDSDSDSDSEDDSASLQNCNTEEDTSSSGSSSDGSSSDQESSVEADNLPSKALLHNARLHEIKANPSSQVLSRSTNTNTGSQSSRPQQVARQRSRAESRKKSKVDYLQTLLKNQKYEVYQLRAIIHHFGFETIQIDEALARLRDKQSVKDVLRIVKYGEIEEMDES